MEYPHKPVEALYFCPLFPQPPHPESLEHLSDWTLIFLYMTLPCPRAGCLQWSNCWGYHSPVDRRRMLVFAEGKFNYEGVKCGVSGLITTANMRTIPTRSLFIRTTTVQLCVQGTKSLISVLCTDYTADTPIVLQSYAFLRSYMAKKIHFRRLILKI